MGILAAIWQRLRGREPAWLVRLRAGRICAACARGVEHHSNSLTSIGRAEDRYPIFDLHAEPEGYGYVTYECVAGDLWLTWERARRAQRGLPGPDYRVRTEVPS